jgi:uncharacterized membrane protein
MNFRRITWIVLIGYLLVTVYSVAVMWLNIPQLFPITPVSTLLAFSFAILHSGLREGWRKTAYLAVIVFLTGLIFECVGVATGWVYGPYHYTDKLGVKFLGLVPLLIPLAWTMMMYPSLVISDRLIPHAWQGRLRWLAVAALGGMIMTAWDVVMDPLMVSGGHWVWEVSGPYFGVPLQNYWGWWLTTFVALLVYQAAASRIRQRPAGIGIPDGWAVASYLITAASTVIVAGLAGLGGPALAGIFAMTPWLALTVVHKEAG